MVVFEYKTQRVTLLEYLQLENWLSQKSLFCVHA